MISVQECRQYFEGKQLTDEQIELIRNFLYKLAEMKIKEHVKT